MPVFEPPSVSLLFCVKPIGSSFFMKGSTSSLTEDLGPTGAAPRVLGFMGLLFAVLEVVVADGIDDFTTEGFFKPVDGLESLVAVDYFKVEVLPS